MTMDELNDLPAVVNLETAGRAIGCSRSTAYGLQASGQFPVPVRQVGVRYKVSKADLLRYLGIHSPAEGIAEDSAGVRVKGGKVLYPNRTYRVKGSRLIALMGRSA